MESRLSIHLILPLALTLWFGQGVHANRRTADHSDFDAKLADVSFGGAEDRVAQRDFFVLAEITSQPAVAEVWTKDPVFRKLLVDRSKMLTDAFSICKQTTCFDKILRWSDQDIDSVAAELRQLYRNSPATQSYADHKLRESGQYPLYRSRSGEDLLVAAWTDAAQAMNRIINIYGDGVPPYYKVDAMEYSPSAGSYVDAVRTIAVMVQQQEDAAGLFFLAPMRYAVLLLAINDRLDAARFDPLDRGENAPAIMRAKSTNWGKYDYSVIMVPGHGPEEPNVALSPLGRITVQKAAQLYRQHRAPFILLSGGTVHPTLTKYCEAVEMRRELIEDWGVPADAILIDPYARHTTTNLRNTVRELSYYHMPTDKPVLITSDPKQIDMILNPAFNTRCLHELHYAPYTSLHRLSQTDMEMMPNLDSLQMDAMDPMDP